MNEQDMINQALSLQTSASAASSGTSVPWYTAIANAVNSLSPAAKNIASTINTFNAVNANNASMQTLSNQATAPGQINLLGQAFSQYWWLLILALVAVLALIFAVKQ